MEDGCLWIPLTIKRTSGNSKDWSGFWHKTEGNGMRFIKSTNSPFISVPRCRSHSSRLAENNLRSFFPQSLAHFLRDKVSFNKKMHFLKVLEKIVKVYWIKWGRRGQGGEGSGGMRVGMERSWRKEEEWRQMKRREKNRKRNVKRKKRSKGKVNFSANSISCLHQLDM